MAVGALGGCLERPNPSAANRTRSGKNYPRVGYALTPPLLTNILDRPFQAGSHAGLDLRLKDLDADAAASLPTALWRAAADEIVAAVARDWCSVEAHRPLASFDSPKAIERLDLSLRTYNALMRGSVQPSQMQIADLMALHGFGIRSLLEVLIASEKQGGSGRGELSEEANGALGRRQIQVSRAADPASVTSSATVLRWRARALEMHAMYQEGHSLQQVGTRFKLTRERVRQIFVREHLPIRSVREAAALKKARMRNLHQAEIERLAGGGLSAAEIAARVSIPRTDVHEILELDEGYRRRKRIVEKSSRPRYSDEELVRCLREANIAIGGVLTTAAYTEFSRGRKFADGRPWPTHQTPFLRFGSWRAGLAAAGLASNPTSAIAGKRLFTKGHCVEAILEVEREIGQLPTASEYEQRAAHSNGVLPSLATVRHRLGTWSDALTIAVRFSEEQSDR